MFVGWFELTTTVKHRLLWSPISRVFNTDKPVDVQRLALAVYLNVLPVTGSRSRSLVNPTELAAMDSVRDSTRRILRHGITAAVLLKYEWL